MDSHRLTKLATMVNMASLLFVLLAVTSSVTGSGRYYDDVVFPAVERRGGNPACRRCVLNRHDWSSCTSCFRYARLGSGRIPYYGLRKRSPPNDDVETPDDVIECCAVTGNPECCRHVEFRRAPAASVEKLDPRYVRLVESDELDNPGGSMCSCCDVAIYDSVCCQAGCGV